MSTLQVANIWFESTANNRIQYASNTLTFIAGGANTFVVNSTSIVTNAAIVARGSNGTSGQVLTSNGSGIFWSDVAGSGGTGTVAYIEAGNGISTSSGNPITSTGVLNVRAGTGLIANATGVYVNAAYINTLASNNAMYLNGNQASDFVAVSGLAANVAKLDANNALFIGGLSATNIVNTVALTASLSYYQTTAGLRANVAGLGLINTAASYTITGVHTYNANIALTGTLLLSGSNGTPGQVLTSNGNGNAYWSTVSGGGATINANTGIISNADGIFVNSAYIATLTVNNATNFNSQPATYYTNATNMSSGTLPYARLGSNIVNTTAAFTFANVHTYNANINLNSMIVLNNDTGIPGQVLTSNGSSNVYWSTVTDIQPITVALSNETDAITTGIAKVTIRAPYAMTLTSLPRAYLSTASTSGNPTVNIKVSGGTIFGSMLSIDANEKTSTTAATPASLITTSIQDDAEITFDVTVAGTGAKGLKVTLYTKRAL